MTAAAGRQAADPLKLDPSLLARIEEAGLNASAPREQRWVDGWLLRIAPGKAKRARCIQPVAAGTTTIDERLARCLPAFEAAGLPAFVRITPFARPEELDAHLARLGWRRVDDSIVMCAEVGAVCRPASEPAPAIEIEAVDAAAFAAWIGTARGSTALECRSHADRVAGSPVPYRAWVVRDASGAAIAGAQLAIEDDLAGFYDVLVEAPLRGRGLATRLCARLAHEARSRGARTLYLQVDAANAAAIAVYRRLGFVEAYRYHYRTPVAPGGAT